MVPKMFTIILLGIIHTCCGGMLFSVGNEFKYNYETLVIVGSQEPTSFASGYKLKGFLVVSSISSTTLSVNLENLSVGMYNGPWTYFPIPDIKYFTSSDLTPLTQPFHISHDNGKVTAILLDDQEPEWASNIKRGLATYLQMDLHDVNFNEFKTVNKKELTTVGECRTRYEILPGSTTFNRLTQVRKFRNHADCPDVPMRTRYATHIFYPCGDKDTRDILNSTAYSLYEMEVNNGGQPLLKEFQLFSSVLYWPFTSNGPYQFSWVNMTFSLDSITPLNDKVLPPPANAETHEDLSYVFEQSDPTHDPEDENPELTNEVLYFHHLTVDSEPETYRKTVEFTKKTIAEIGESLVNTETFFDDTKKFHENSPHSLIFLLASLDYDNLKQLYTFYNSASSSSASKLTLQLFLDGLILAGTTPATLVIRDVLLTNTDLDVLSRLAPSLPHFIRNPTEALAKEMDPLFALMSKDSINPSIRRTITFSLASLIGRCCRKTNCVTTDLLQKYINYFENKLTTATDFEERTVGLLGLRNLRVGKSLEKVMEIATGKLIYEHPLRIQAIWSLRSMFYQDSAQLLNNILPIFYNRSESCELRTSVFGFLMSIAPDEKRLHDIAYFMWTETCPMVTNLVRSHLINVMNSKSPCSSPLKSYARTILQYLPPGEVDPLKTTSYLMDYYDRNSGFGHQIYATIQKSGKTLLPVSIYFGLNNYIGGYGSSYLGIFIRMEGVEKAISNKLAAMRSTNVEEIKKILSKIGVTERTNTPLYLEFTVVYHDYVVLHFAADKRSISKLPEFLRDLTKLSHVVKLNWERSVMLGGIFHEFPLEIGTPVSITASVAGIGSIASNITRSKGAGIYSQETNMKLQFNLFGMNRISNHAPGLGTMYSITTYRGLRLVVPRHFSVGVDMRLSVINMFINPPTENDPLLAMAHGTAVTSVGYDAPTQVNDDIALELLHKSCSHCNQVSIVSRGAQFRNSRVLPLTYPSLFRGMISEIKYFDCERDHSRPAVLKKFRNYFQEENQYAGLYDFPLAKLFLSLSHARDHIFISPFPETCGIYAQIAQNETAETKLQRIEGQIKGGVTLRAPNVQDNFTAFVSSKLDLKFTGLTPSITKLKFNLELKEPSVETQTVNIKMQANDELSLQHGVICIKIDTSTNRLPKDLLSYEGENEPKAEQRIKVSMGRAPKEGTNQEDPPCSENHAAFDVSTVLTQSAEQKAEAASNVFPYLQCRAQKGSPEYPGSCTPPSAECHAAVWEQTNLRAGNVTIKYKVAEEVQKRWRRTASIISGILYPYSSVSDEIHFTHTGHTNASSLTKSGIKYFEGEVDLDINLKKNAPIMDVHFHDITHSREEHYHGVDLGILPSFLRPHPVPSRISPLWTLAFKLGVVSHCSVTPRLVNTLDGFTYSAPLSNCWTLLNADCGQNIEFAILGKRISDEKIGILIHFGENKVEFTGTANPIIDGKQETLEERKIFMSESATPLPFDIFKNGNEAYVISYSLGIYVRYTGHFVTVTLGSRYRAVHCGLCGHWDSSLYNDLIGPNSSCPALLQSEDMLKAYVMNEGSCVRSGYQCPSSV